VCDGFSPENRQYDVGHGHRIAAGYPQNSHDWMSCELVNDRLKEKVREQVIGRQKDRQKVASPYTHTDPQICQKLSKEGCPRSYCREDDDCYC
jgi:hypothetical protein